VILGHERLKLGILAICAGPLATIAITPSFSFDPINPIKLLVISILGFICLFGLTRQLSWVRSQNFDKRSLYAVTFFLVQLILVFLLSGTNPLQEFYGASGRNIGFLAYFGLLCLFLATTLTANKHTLDFLVHSLLVTGAISVIYGLIQALNLDPANWLNRYNPVIGFLGNPDFQSAFLGIVAVISSGMLFKTNQSKLKRISLMSLAVFSLLVIQQTKALQGFMVFAIGLVSILLLHIYQRGKWVFLSFATSGSAILALLAAFGSLDKGPLAKILHQNSVIYRGDYWHAGWKMSIEHPWFGVGLDSYGDWYRRSRTLAATLRRGPNITSDTAHNALLDFSANGGFPLLLAYLFFILLTVLSVVKIFKDRKLVDPVFIALVGGWIAFQSQSIISINQIGLTVWGWLFMGMIIGYGLNNSKIELTDKIPKIETKRKNKQSSSSSFISLLLVGGLVGFVTAFPNFVADSNFRAALASQEVKRVVDASKKWPQDSVRIARVVGALRENQLNDDALKLAREGATKFPDFFGSWNELSQLTNATPAEIVLAKVQMKRLDPHNPDLK
jgi:O-antigen ligase